MTRADVKRFVYIPLTEEKRFLVFAMDGESGKLTLKHDIDLPAQPWQLCISPDRRFLYQQVRTTATAESSAFESTLRRAA